MKNERKQYKNKKFKIIWNGIRNDEFELPDDSYSVSDIQDYIKHILKVRETLRKIPPIHSSLY